MSGGNKGTVILTGAGGFVGINMTKVMIDEGFRVIGLDINDEGLKIVEEMGAEAIKCDMLKENLVPIFQKAEKESNGNLYMVHIAGLFKFDAPAKPLFKINVRLTKIVMEAALKVKGWKHIIHISTVGTYGTPAVNRKSSPHKDLVPYSENDPQIPDNTYGISKMMGEEMAWKYHKKGLPISVIRPSLIYGPYNRYGIALFLQLGSYCKNLMTGALKYILLFPLAIPCRGATWATFIHVEDLCRATSLILQKDETLGEAYTLGDEKPVNTIAFFNIMMDVFKLKFNWKIVPLSRLVIKHYPKLFNKFTTNLLEKVLTFCFKIYGWRMKYDPTNIDLEISQDWLGYFQSNYIWDVKKLKKLGFKHKWTFRKGVLSNLIWYKKNKWLP